MKRRELLRAAGAAAALSLAPRRAEAAWGRLLDGYRAADGLTDAQRAFVSAVADIILPRTDTPGASDVGVTDWVNLVVAEYYTDTQRTQFVNGLDAMQLQMGTAAASFVQLSAEEQRERVIRLDSAAGRQTADGRTFVQLKRLVLHGYFTSERVQKDVLKVSTWFDHFEGAAQMPPETRAVSAPLKQDAYDAIVVGSGITGGWAAKELTERGLRTLVLEAGWAASAKDFGEHVQPYEMRFRGYGDQATLLRNQPIQRECYACDEVAHKFFVNDTDNPYTTATDTTFRWFRGRQVGGRSITWGRQVYRWSDLDFEANAKDGHGTDWPVRYKDIAPWYSHVEKFIGVTGAKEKLSQLPDGEFLPPMEMTVVERHAREKLLAAFKGERVMTIGRAAILTKNHKGRAACHYCGPCERGCETHSYFNSIGSTLPAAEKTGRLTLRPNSVVAEVLYDAAAGRARGVRVIDAVTMQEMEFTARVIFLCASTIESVRLLLNSKSTTFPDGLANSSGLLGRYIMDHHYGSGASGQMPGFLDKRTVGRRPNGIYIARFRNVKTQHPGFLRGYGMQGGSSRAGWSRGNNAPGIGAEFKQSLIDDLGGWTLSASGWGEMLPQADNRITLDPNVKDKWGIPAARMDVRWGDNERAMERDMQTGVAEMLEAAGCTNVRTHGNNNPPGHCIHEMGGARMSKDAKDGVVNKWNQAWDVKNLFVTDGAAMSSCACQNPSITYMAFTARAAAHAVGELKRRAL